MFPVEHKVLPLREPKPTSNGPPAGGQPDGYGYNSLPKQDFTPFVFSSAANEHPNKRANMDFQFFPTSEKKKLGLFTFNLPTDSTPAKQHPSPPVMVKESETDTDSGAESRSSCDASSSSGSSGAVTLLETHLKLLDCGPRARHTQDEATAPIFTEAVRASSTFPQYGLLGGHAGRLSSVPANGLGLAAKDDPRIYYNVAAPSSVFICGSQGSGKSHTLSCLLENCMVPSAANVLPRPLSGLVFHYDTFVSDTGGSPCEAAYLSSDPNVSVRVICAPTNVAQIKRIYSPLRNVTIEEFRLNQSDLNTKRMLDLMAVSSIQGGMPLYLHIVVRILRDMRIYQQQRGVGFDYATFKQQLEGANLTRDQMAPLLQRLDTLESFMVHKQASAFSFTQPTSNSSKTKGEKVPSFQTNIRTNIHTGQQRATVWKPKAGQLTIVDLSCPCVTAEMACLLFNICLGLYLEQDCSKIGRVIALDEAHKYMTDTAEASTLTESLLSTIRLQRHVGARIIISTQEPTISPRLLDLCSVTLVHRFTSPDWLQSLKKHLAGASVFRVAKKGDGDGDDRGIISIEASEVTMQLFSEIIALRTGEALMFAPTALIGVNEVEESASSDSSGVDGSNLRMVALGNDVMKLRVRKRVTSDGGRSIMAI